MTALRISLFVLAALAVAVAANLVLLRLATGPSDPVGSLSPRSGLVRLPAPAAKPPPAAATTTTRSRGENPPGSHPDD
jgi:hypothetical protein